MAVSASEQASTLWTKFHEADYSENSEYPALAEVLREIEVPLENLLKEDPEAEIFSSIAYTVERIVQDAVNDGDILAIDDLAEAIPSLSSVIANSKNQEATSCMEQFLADMLFNGIDGLADAPSEAPLNLPIKPAEVEAFRRNQWAIAARELPKYRSLSKEEKIWAGFVQLLDFTSVERAED